MNYLVKLTKKEATERVISAFTNGNENFYDVDIELSNGNYMTATPENIDNGVKFWLVK